MTADETRADRRRFDTELLEAFDRVRSELRDEVRASEGRVQASLLELRSDFDAATVTHAGIHAVEGESRSIAHSRFEAFMQRAELEAARRDGALGIIRFGFDLVGRNWRGIVALGGVVAMILGNIRVDVGVGQ